MSFEPQKFFIGVVDFFAVLLPVALLSFFLWQYGPFDFVDGSSISGILIAAFLFSSYVLGHFVFLLGAVVLDHALYDPLATAADRISKRDLAGGPHDDALSWKERLACRIFGPRYQRAMRCTERIKEHHLARLNAADTINVFQWCKAQLTLDSEAGLATVQRFEADSKFFRSFAVVLTLLLAAIVIRADGVYVTIGAASAILMLLLLALWRYVEQRTKATIFAMVYVITVESRRSDGYRTQPSHGGGVVRRGKGKSREYLLVQASKNPSEWVLPKGHIEPGESAEAAAVREVREETGVSARIDKPLGRIVFIDGDGRNVSVQFFLMEAVGDQSPPAEPRGHKWLSLPDALRQATHLESKGLLASQLK